jgi:hypothetical protein
MVLEDEYGWQAGRGGLVMMINLFVKLTGPWSTQAFGRTLF